ncbi:MAG: glycosyltransferase family 4 protein [Marinifilaceae bacterium]
MPNGLFYLKADGKVCIPARQRDDNVLIYNIKLYLWNKGLKLTDVISTETIYNYNLSINTNKNNSNFISKFIIVPNGFDAYTLDQFNLPELKLEEKDNIIIFVGKVGSYFKNNELILSALEKIDFKSDWKFYFIGPVEDHFEEKVKAIFIKHPNLKDRIKLIGPIFDKKELWDYYRHAKVFVLSSISESYALVLNEAFKFNNYIVSTPVGVAPELVQYGYGELYEHNNAEQLASILQKIINDTSYLQDRYNQCQIDTKVNDWSIIIDNLIAKFQEIKTYDKFTHNKKF